MRRPELRSHVNGHKCSLSDGCRPLEALQNGWHQERSKGFRQVFETAIDRCGLSSRMACTAGSSSNFADPGYTRSSCTLSFHTIAERHPKLHQTEDMHPRLSEHLEMAPKWRRTLIYPALCSLASSDQLLRHRQPRQLSGAAGGNPQGACCMAYHQRTLFYPTAMQEP